MNPRSGLLALLFLALAVPAIPADDPVIPVDDPIRSTVDIGGPRIATTWVNKNPIPPSTTLVIGAMVIDDQGSPIRSVWGVLQGTLIPFPPADSAFDSPTEVVEYIGVSPSTDGTYLIAISASDAWLNVGTPVTISLVVQSIPPSPNGHLVSASVIPAAVSAGTSLEVHALVNRTGNISAAVEYFIDVLGLDGTGVTVSDWTPMSATTFDFQASLETSGLARGNHTAYVHAMIESTWSAYIQATFFVGAPDMTLSVLGGPATVAARDSLAVAVMVKNIGCGTLCTAASVQVDVTLTGGLVITADNAAMLGASRWGSISYGLPDLVDGTVILDLTLLVPADALDGEVLVAEVSLAYSTLAGTVFGSVRDLVSFEVRGPEMVVSVAADRTTAYPGDPVVVETLLSNVGTYPAADVRVQVDATPGLELLGSNALDLGGLESSPGVFEFPALPPGDHMLRSYHRLTDGVADGDGLVLNAEISFTSRHGVTETWVRTTTVEALRPGFLVSLEGMPTDLEIGGRAEVTVRLSNTGSAPALAELRLDGNGRLRIDGSPLPFRVESDVAVFDLGMIAPEERAFNVTLVSLAGDGRPGVLSASLSSRSPSGTPLGIAAAEAGALLLPVPTLPPPVPPTTPPISVPSDEPSLPVAIVPVALASISLLGYALTDRGRAGFFLFFVPLYTRLRREQILEHETRGMIRGYVLANPGSHFNAIKDSLDLNNGTLAYHLNVLEKEGIIRSVKDGKFRRFFPSEMKIPNNGELPTKVQRLVLEIVLETPAISQKEISRILGLSQSTVSYHLDRLKELGLVRAERQGMQLCYFVLPGGIEIISTTA